MGKVRDHLIDEVKPNGLKAMQGFCDANFAIGANRMENDRKREDDLQIETIRDLIDLTATQHGESVFLLSPETGRTLNFAGLREQSRALSDLLRKAGLERGDKVAFMLENGMFTVQLFLGTIYGGFVSVPLNVRGGVAQLAFTLDHCDAKVVFVEEQYAALAEEVLARIGKPIDVIPADVDAFIAEGGTPLDGTTEPPLSGEDTALLMYTSGSVGQPRAVIHTHRTLLAHGRNSVEAHRLTLADRSLLVLPIYHINAECVTLMPTLVAGGSVVVPHRFDVSQFWDLFTEHRCTWSAVVPTIVAQLVDWKDPKVDQRKSMLKQIRFLRSSSAPLSPSLQREFISKFDLLLIQAMGSSEAGNIFSNPLPPAENKIGTPGLAWGFDTRIIDRDGNDVARGTPGEVLIRGAALSSGYYKDSEGTAAAIDADGWMHTGDLAYQDADGYFFLIGRSKELIIKGGMNIAPRQIDEVLESHPAVLEAAAVGVPDHYVGEDIIAFAVLRAGMHGDERELLAFCESRLGHFKTPTRVHFVTDLPKGPSGKVQRLRLLTEIGPWTRASADSVEGESTGDAQHDVDGDVERVIVECWSSVLGHREFNEDANFFALGGHSLMAIQCLSRIREKLPVLLSLSQFFENPTLKQLSNLIKERLCSGGQTHGAAPASNDALRNANVAKTGSSIARRGRNLPYPISPGQQRIWFLGQLAPTVPLYNEAEAVRLRGELRADVLEQALNIVVSRHEILRSVLRSADEFPILVVLRNWALQIKRIDLSALSSTRKEAEVERLLIEEPRQPYHLESEPGIRATLVRVGPTDHVLILMLHHMICDLASLTILWSELSSAYRAILRGESVNLPSLPLQYGDYAVWQQQRAEEGAFEGDLDFWEKNLCDAPEMLELPTDRPRPPVRSYAGERFRKFINAELAELLRRHARKENTSLFNVFTAALNVLLYRHSGSDDILVGIPIGERERPELQSVMGFLLHTQILRTRMSADMTFRELLTQVQREVVALYNHREVPFDQVVRRLRPDRDPSHSPLFQVMLNWRGKEQQFSFLGLEGLKVESLLAEARISKFELTLLVTDAECISLEAEYDSDLFDRETIERLLDNYITLLTEVATDTDRPISTLALLSKRELEHLVYDCNDTQVDFPKTHCAHHLIEAQAASTPHKIAIEYEGQRLTYAQLNEKADRVSRCLAQRGVKPGALVGVVCERSLDLVVALLSVLKSGAAYVPIDPSYPVERIALVLNDSRAQMVLTQKSLANNLPTSATGVIYLDELDSSAVDDAGATCSRPTADDLAYVIYTSGSTGVPKGVEIPHRALVNLLCSMRKRPGMDQSDTIVAVTTVSFDIAALELFLPLTVGAKLIIATREQASDGRLLLKLLGSSGASVIQATPITFRMLVEADWSAIPALKVLSGGEALSRDLADEILPRCEQLWNMYGPTETTIWSAAAEVHRGQGTVTIGGPIDNMQFHILDRTGRVVPTGVVGELYIGGVGLARGYFNRPELTAEKFVDVAIDGPQPERLYRTGDQVRRRADGQIEFLGRLDNQVKLRGFRIELEEIEAALKRHPAIKETAVRVQNDERVGSRLVAYLVPNDAGGLPSAEEMREALRHILPEYMVPATFVTLEAMPLTPNRKIDRKALPAPDLTRQVSETYIAPRTEMEKGLVEVWSKVLQVNQIGVHDNFFDLGGHSLLAMRLISEVRKVMHEEFSVQEFFQDPTIEKMACVLEKKRAVAPDSEKRAFHLVLRRGEKRLAMIGESDRLVHLQRGRGRLPFFIVDAFPYFIDVVRLLSRDQPVLSLVGDEVRSAPSGYSLALEAEAHVKTILESSPEGPYMLGGCSASGIVAYEVARQLTALKHQVALLTIFDAVNPYFMREYSPLRRSFAYNMAAIKNLRWTEVPGWTVAKVATAIGLSKGMATPIGNELGATTDASQFGLSSERIAAARAYRPQPFEGRFLLFKSWRRLGGRYRDSLFGWGEVVRGDVEVCQLSAEEHLDLFKSEVDRKLVAQKLRIAFDEVAAEVGVNDLEERLIVGD
jgi:amino acid adenylation domain-containing protein